MSDNIFDQEQAIKEYTRLMEAGPVIENEAALSALLQQAYVHGLYFDQDRSGQYRLVKSEAEQN